MKKWLAFGLLFVIFPHFFQFPPLVSAFCAAILLSAMIWPEKNPFKGWILKLVSVAAAVLIFLEYGTIFNQDAGMALFALLICLKTMEIKSLRDTTLILFLGYFYILTQFLNSQTMVWAAFLLASVLILTAIFYAANREEAQAGEAFQFSFRLVLQSLPLMFLLFVLFPRIPGPLWGLAKSAETAKTGLSDSLSPGGISRLGLSDEVAFRVNFDGEILPKPALYWRGPVFDRFDGKTWSATSQLPAKVSFKAKGPFIKYTVTLEPYAMKWLFALDLPATIPPQSFLTRDFQILSPNPIKQRMRYDMVSVLDYEAGDDDPNLEKMTQIPLGSNPKAEALAQKWKNSLSPEATALEALKFFRNEPFFYTLTPPLSKGNTIDDFLFDSRAGFCEHYASSFAYLMRAAKIPARIVAGYQGGEINPIGRYLVVRQADAHAWVEIWLEHRGWVRIDPTAAVSPLRIESGISAALGAREPLPALMRSDSELLRRIRFSLDASANLWNQWVVGFEQQKQEKLLSDWGLRNSAKRLTALLIGTGILFGAVAAVLLHRREKIDPVQKAYLSFCRKMDREGIRRLPHEGPLDYSKRIASSRPDLFQAAEPIISLYIALRYGAQKEGRESLEKLVRKTRF